ncbi:rCG40444 [Rattus norvegicus]|uniref:RCG40444 n=1 Tax=Rattus norvegicus TaxID=10116 RepID=A6I8D1_RAT|nr:rCG40444 [Rattus norvegicus]
MSNRKIHVLWAKDPKKMKGHTTQSCW